MPKKKKKMPELEFEGRIDNIDDLINQLVSLKEDSLVFFSSDQVFHDDFHALRIAIKYFKQLKEVTQ